MKKVLDTATSLEALSQRLVSSDRVFYTRFGDNDIIMAHDKNVGVLGNNQTRWSPELQQEMLESIAINDPDYLKAFSLDYPLEPGMMQGLFAPFEAQDYIGKQELEEKLNAIAEPDELYNPVLFHYLAVFRTQAFRGFLDLYIRPRRKMFIGNCSKEQMEKMFGPIDFYVKTPAKNAYDSIDEWWPQVEKDIDKVDVVLPCAGQATRVVQKRLWHLGARVHSIDIGSVVDALDNQTTRTWIRLKGWVVKQAFDPDPVIKVIVPYFPGNLGKAYNDAMRELRDDEWALFLDHDCLIMRPNWYEMCVHAISHAPDAGWITGVTNSIWCEDQLATCNSDSINDHIALSNMLFSQHGFSFSEESEPDKFLGNVFSGMFILTSKRAWKDAGGFEEDIKVVQHEWNGKDVTFVCNQFTGVDNDYCLKLRAKGYKTYVLKGLYLYHLREKKKEFLTELPRAEEPAEQPPIVTEQKPEHQEAAKEQGPNRKQRRAREKQLQKLKGMKPKISAIMMAKNEEKSIERCLKSIKPFVDEIILVDTGSTDSTNEIARKYGAKIFEHPWEDSFSAGRNHSVSHATGDWLIQIDCDEEAFGDPVLLKKFFREAVPKEINGISVTIRDVQGGLVCTNFNPARMFRRGTVHYERLVHNKARFGSGTAYVPHEIFSLNHYGYDLSPEEKKAKLERSVSLLKKQIEMDPSDWESYFYLSQMYGWNEQWEESNKYAEEYIKHKDEMGSDFNPSVYFSAFRHYMYLKDLESARRWLEMGLKDIPDHLDLLLGMVEYGSTIKRPDLVWTGAREYLKNYALFEQKRAELGSRFVQTYQPNVAAFCSMRLFEVHLMQAQEALKFLDNMLPQTDINSRHAFEREIARTLNALGKKPR